MTNNDKADKVQEVTMKTRAFDELPPAAQRALKEAEERRKNENLTQAPREIGGRGGKDPARFGDWEIKGRTIDF